MELLLNKLENLNRLLNDGLNPIIEVNGKQGYLTDIIDKNVCWVDKKGFRMHSVNISKVKLVENL